MQLPRFLKTALVALLVGVNACTYVTAAATTSSSSSSNGPYIFDTDGNAIDSTSGKVHFINGLYVWYGISFGCGSAFCGIQAWSSPDLKRWQNEGYLFDYNEEGNKAICAETGNCGRPHMLYDDKTKQYILWVNAGAPGYQLFTSTQPYSGFVASSQRALVGFQPQATMAGDFTVEVINGTGYLVYSSIDFKTVGASIWPPFNQTLFVQQLTTDLMNTTGPAYQVLTNGDLVDYEAESPDLFYRNGWYYITASDTCGFCTGTLLILYRSKSIQGPWKRQILSGDTCGGQTTGVFPVSTTTGQKFVHQADLFGSSPLASLRTAAHGYHFQALSFKSNGEANNLDCSADSNNFGGNVVKVNNYASRVGLEERATDSSRAAGTYNQVCNYAQNSYYQTWVSSKTGSLTKVGVNMAALAPNGPITVTVFRLQNNAQLQSPHFVWETLQTATFQPADISQALLSRVVSLSNVSVKSGDHLGFAITTSSTTPFCYLQSSSSSSSHALFYNGAAQVSYRGSQGKTSPVLPINGQEVKWYAIVE